MFPGGHQFQGFDGSSVRIKGVLFLSVVHSKPTSSYTD